MHIESLLDVSARIGSEPLLVQAATGNTSIKLDGVLWIKASGKWLSQAGQEEILIPVDLAETRRRLERGCDPAGQTGIVHGKQLGTSVETAMHAVLPHRVVLHVHSANVIAWAVRHDGPGRLAGLLDGIEWQWIRYVASGLPLAREIAGAVERFPQTRVLVLANHGLVVCGETCEEAEALLREVERRVDIAPRSCAEPDWGTLARLADNICWRVPEDSAVHALGTDPIAREILSGGILYPCQAIFLTAQAASFGGSISPETLANVQQPFVTIEGAGVLVRGQHNQTRAATLAGLSQVLRRIPQGAPVRYLNEDEVGGLLCADVYHYREMVEDNGAATALMTARQRA